MQPSPPPSAAPANPQKARTGLNRIWHAAGYSLEGLRAGWNEKAFRQEAIGAMVLLPLSLWLGENVLKLEQSRNKAWSQVPDELGSRTQFSIDQGAARVREFRSWDDRVTSQSAEKRPYIGARNCRG